MSVNIQKKILTRIGGQKCQGTLFVAGGIFILFLGDVLQKMGKNKPLRTRWRFWIDCAWRIRKGGKIVAGCYDDIEDICTKARGLKGAMLVDIHHKNVSHDLELFFDNGMCIELFSDSTTGSDMWEVRGTDGYRYTLDKGLKIRERMSEPDGWEYERKGIDEK